MAHGIQAEVYELAHDEARRALDIQARAIDEMRVRTGVLASAAVLTTSFFGSSLVSGAGVSIFGWFALGLFGLSIWTAVLILWPRSWEFSANSANIIATYVETTAPLPIDQIHRELALHMQSSYDENQRGLSRLNRWFQWSVLAVGFEVILWISNLAAYN